MGLPRTTISSIDVLDSSCGIGTQAIGLARLGYRVRGTDISERSLERARVEAARLGVDIAFVPCDFRDLKPVEGAFDAVISCDNAIPHLLTDEDLSRAFRAMRSKLRPGGLLVISVRDYDKALVDRPATATPQINPGPPRKVLVRLHDWDSPDSPMYSVHFLVLTEGPAGWTVAHHSSRYRAVGRATITRAAEDVGFTQVTWYWGRRRSLPPTGHDSHERNPMRGDSEVTLTHQRAAGCAVRNPRRPPLG